MSPYKREAVCCVRQCEDGEERDIAQPSNAHSHQKLEEARNRFSPTASRGRVAMSTPWLSDFWPLLLWENKFLLFCTTKHVVVLLQQQQETNTELLLVILSYHSDYELQLPARLSSPIDWESLTYKDQVLRTCRQVGSPHHPALEKSVPPGSGWKRCQKHQE